MKQTMKYLNFRLALGAAAFLVALSSCGEAKFKIEGEINGADNQPVVLEKSDFHGRWVAIDSTRTNASGAFSISRSAPAAPEIFRLHVDGKYIYVPIDSIETVNVESSLANFGSEFSLSGSDNAVRLADFEKELMALPENVSEDSLRAFKRSVFSKYMRQPQASIVSYYILTKTFGKRYLFDTNTDDYKYFAAVATGYKDLRPNDPHTALLEKTSLDALKRKNQERGSRIEINAPELKVIDIDLPNEDGKNVKLSSIVNNGKKTVVIFSLLTHPDSPAINMALSDIYKSGNVNFYQVSLDPDQYAWRDAAKNLPWITVYDPDGQYSRAAVSYNVSAIPSFYIYSTAGELVDSAFSIDELKKKL